MDKLQELYEELGKEIKKLKSKTEDVIYVPEIIQFKEYCGDGDRFGLVFDIDRVLFIEDNGLYVRDFKYSDAVKCKLIPVDKPETGNWYFASNSEKPNFNIKTYYHKYISPDRYYHVKEKNIIYDRIKYDYYWQVVRVDDD